MREPRATRSVQVDKRIDAGILTIIPREVEAVFKVFGINPEDFANVTHPLDYWETPLFSPRCDRELRVVVTFLSGTAGNTESGIATAYFLRDWHPRIMCLCGIAAGVEGKVRIGDVVLPDKVHDVCVTVRSDGEDLPRDDLRHRDALVDRMLKLRPLKPAGFNEECGRLAFDLDSLERVARSKNLSNIHFQRTFSVHDGSLISGNVLLRDARYFADVRMHKDEKARCAEMEAAGFTRACEIEAVPWLIVRAISDFGDDRKDDAFQSLAAVNAALALRMLLAGSVEFDQLPHRVTGTTEDSFLGANIIADFLAAYQAGRWEQTVLIGSFLSRPLWVSGKYELRRTVGTALEDAAAKADRPLERAVALIDDLGWTSYILHDKASALKHLRDGLRLAQDVQEPYYVAKAHRHLASIARAEGDLDAAAVSLQCAYDECARISAPRAKEEMETSLVLSRAKLLVAQQRPQDAYDLLISAKTAYERAGDLGRAVKTFSVLGRIAEALGRPYEARTCFEKGYEVAERVGRKDEMLANALHLAAHSKQSNDLTKTLSWLAKSLACAQELGDYQQARAIRAELASAAGKVRRIAEAEAAE